MSLSNIVAMSTLAYDHHSLDDALRGISRAGFRYVELLANRGGCEHVRADMDDDASAAVLEQLTLYRLKVSSLNANLGLITREGIDLSKKAISLAARLGAH